MRDPSTSFMLYEAALEFGVFCFKNELEGLTNKFTLSLSNQIYKSKNWSMKLYQKLHSFSVRTHPSSYTYHDLKYIWIKNYHN